MERFATVASLLFLIACVSASEEANLRLRLSDYEKNWANHRYDEVWRMMSQSLRDENGQEGKQFVEFVRRSEASLVRLEIDKIRIDDDKATVRARVTIRSTTSEESKQEIQEQQWVKVKGEWFFSSYRSVQ